MGLVKLKNLSKVKRFNLEKLEFTREEIQQAMVPTKSLGEEIAREYSKVIKAHLKRLVEVGVDYDICEVGDAKKMSQNSSLFSRVETYENGQAFIKLLKLKKEKSPEFFLSQYRVYISIDQKQHVLTPLLLAMYVDDLDLFQFILQEYVRDQQVLPLTIRNQNLNFHISENSQLLLDFALNLLHMQPNRVNEYAQAIKMHSQIAIEYQRIEMAGILADLSKDPETRSAKRKRDELNEDSALTEEPAAKRSKGLAEDVEVQSSAEQEMNLDSAPVQDSSHKMRFDYICLDSDQTFNSSNNSSEISSPSSPEPVVENLDLAASSSSIGAIDLMDDNDSMVVDSVKESAKESRSGSFLVCDESIDDFEGLSDSATQTKALNSSLMCEEELDFDRISEVLQSVDQNSPVKFKKPHTPERIRQQRARQKENGSMSISAKSSTYLSSGSSLKKGSSNIRKLTSKESEIYEETLRSVDWEQVAAQRMY